MSLNVLIAISVLACDFLIYAFFQWTFGEKRREFRRRHPVAKTAPKAQKKTSAIEVAAPRPYLVASRERYRPTDRHVA
jgi:hypothetical protein